MYLDGGVNLWDIESNKFIKTYHEEKNLLYDQNLFRKKYLFINSHICTYIYHLECINMLIYYHIINFEIYTITTFQIYSKLANY